MKSIQLEPTTFTQINQRTIPTAWRISIPHLSIDLTFNALNRKAYMKTSVPYWEGPINVTGSHEGVGYLEMTGY
jgi:predicted secreted hydrolase